MKMPCLVLATMLAGFPALTLADAAGPSLVQIVPQGDGYQLLRNGQPYFAKGICGVRRLDEAVAAGANSIRTYGTSSLDEAHKRGLTVLLGLDVGKPRNGFNYGDTKAVDAMLEKARQNVLKYKDHPALLMWGLGNETELSASVADRLKIWKAVNRMAEMIKQVDGRHPSIVVLGDIGGKKARELNELCPAVDAFGINTYGRMMILPEVLASFGWKRPWFVTEFGPRGHWEVPKTAWGMPVEDTSTEKADLYLRAYRHTIEASPACLGSYVFVWGQKQEKTHTWYGMFLPEGNRLGAVDAMTMAWTGRWPANRCPQIGPGKIKVRLAQFPREYPANVFLIDERLECTVDVTDPENEPLTIKWDLRPDVADNPTPGGDREPPVAPIDGAIISTDGKNAVVQLPHTEGKYRLFVYAFDPKGSAATANLPIRIKAEF